MRLVSPPPEMVTTTPEMVQQQVFHLVLCRLVCPEKKKHQRPALNLNLTAVLS